MNNISEIIRLDRRIIKYERGYFLKIIDGNEEFNPFKCEVYITVAHPGQEKGGHYHKAANEWFTLIKGKAILLLENVKTKEKSKIRLNSLNPVTIFVPPYLAHSFYNDGKSDYILLAYTDKTYHPDDTISYDLGPIDRRE